MSKRFVVWEGVSLIDGKPIVLLLIAPKKSKPNQGTGWMASTLILRSDVSPLDAVHSGEDISVCGTCPLRGLRDGNGYQWPKSRLCYVNILYQCSGPWRAFKAGKLAKLPTNWHSRDHSQWPKLLRMGSYGNPSAVPIKVWRNLLSKFAGHTGYDHINLVSGKRKGWWRFCMASVDSVTQAAEAASMGIRYARVGLPGERPLPGEILCPKTKETGEKTTCSECLLCDGTRSAADRRPSVLFPYHSGMRKIHGDEWAAKQVDKMQRRIALPTV